MLVEHDIAIEQDEDALGTFILPVESVTRAYKLTLGRRSQPRKVLAVEFREMCVAGGHGLLVGPYVTQGSFHRIPACPAAPARKPGRCRAPAVAGQNRDLAAGGFLYIPGLPSSKTSMRQLRDSGFRQEPRSVALCSRIMNRAPSNADSGQKESEICVTNFWLGTLEKTNHRALSSKEPRAGGNPAGPRPLFDRCPYGAQPIRTPASHRAATHAGSGPRWE